jgi:tripartite-type tricarboxylate transporter receptor subunit TctC
MEKKLTAISITKGILVIVLFITGFTALTFGQEYPTQPITLVVGASAGVVDFASRSMAIEAKKLLGVEMLIMSKPGAANTLAVGYVISTRPDGYTLGSTPDTPYVRGPHLLTLNFNPLTDTVPIIIYARYRCIIIVREDSPFKTFQELIDFAKKNPGKLTWGHPGLGTTPYLGFSWALLEMGLNMSQVPFSGDPTTLTSLLGGHINVGAVAGSSVISQINAGKVRILALIDGNERLESFPQVPILKEFAPQVSLPGSTLIIFGPKGLSPSIVKRMEDFFSKASDSSKFKDYSLDTRHMVYRLNKCITGQELRDYLETEYKKNGDLIRRLGLKKKE